MLAVGELRFQCSVAPPRDETCFRRLIAVRRPVVATPTA